jgi:rSAM/selenodomain-associated transferase 2
VISFIIPALDEAESLPRTLGALAALLDPSEEIVVVDGGSRDGTRDVAARFGRVIESPRGRARQMNAGARAARGKLLVFAHADTTFSKEALGELRAAVPDERAHWGFFPVVLDAEGLRYRTIEWGIRIRVALGGCATGDQAIFVRRSTFLAIGGYRDVPLMEDVELARLLCRYFEPVRPRTAVTTSARRWSRRGVARTQLRMWALRLAWRLGVPHEVLAGHYPVVR